MSSPAGRAVSQAEQELQRLKQRQLQETQRLWSQYEPGYERYLHAEPEPEDEQPEETTAPARDAAPSSTDEVTADDEAAS